MTRQDQSTFPSYFACEEVLGIDARNKISGGGLTIREHFAGLAMQSLVAHGENDGSLYSDGHLDHIAGLSVRLADKLIHALSNIGINE